MDSDDIISAMTISVVIFGIVAIVAVLILEIQKPEIINENIKYIQDDLDFEFLVDKETCVEYIIYDSYKEGGIVLRYNQDGTIKVNKECLDE